MKTSEIILCVFQISLFSCFDPPMSSKGVSEAFLRALLHLGSFFMPIILYLVTFFFSFSLRIHKAMTSAGFFFRCHSGYLLYERGLSVLIPNMGAREPTVWCFFFSKGYVLRRANVDGKVLLMMIRFIYQGDKRHEKNAYFDSPAGSS